MSPHRERFVAYDAYEQMADRYAEQIDSKPHNAYLERPATLSLLPDVRGKRVLDAGCGPGAYSEWLAKHGASVIAVDASPKMIQHAMKRLGTSVDLRLHDLREPLGFLERNAVDVVLAPLVLHYIEDWAPVLREFRRVLKDGGILVFSIEHPFGIHEENIKNYFEVEKIEVLWKSFGVSVPSYRRPLEAVINPVIEAGFVVERIIEAQPTTEYKKADPETYETASRRPSFLCVRAAKK